MPFIIDGVCLLEGVELSRNDFFDKLVAGSDVSTSQPSVGDVTEFWTNILKEYDEIVHIPTSSMLSNAYATALALSKDFDGKVRLVDNKKIAAPLMYSVYDAAKLRDQGKTSDEIATILEEQSTEYAIYLSVDSMKYLKKGGRISPAAAAIGSILKIRPVLALFGEKLDKFTVSRTQQKAKEAIKAAIANDFSTKYKSYVDNGEMRLCIVYAESENEMDDFKQELAKAFPNVPFVDNAPMSLSIACHTGPDTIAISYMRVVK
jgi:DegV family protein with EDD domain